MKVFVGPARSGKSKYANGIIELQKQNTLKFTARSINLKSLDKIIGRHFNELTKLLVFDDIPYKKLHQWLSRFFNDTMIITKKEKGVCLRKEVPRPNIIFICECDDFTLPEGASYAERFDVKKFKI